ncbi:unnamed protein product [Arabis nemorensis]|uniref:TF-B3 domain-containing protein n=1 Tax=Arabis nemorensis TaxID=586526 RepID=A0A565C1J9_9BRAS|nr:unnamed protein product [Arabis nemorensis]
MARERETPEWLVNLMREENGFDAKLIFEKELTESDVAKHQGRLLIPLNMIVDREFLNEEELNIIEQHYNGTHVEGVGVTLVDSEGQQWDLNLRRWSMKNIVYYVLVSGWNNVVVDKRLRSGQTIRLWSFHTPHGLYFAM